MEDGAALEVRIRSAEDLQDARCLKVGKVLHSYACAWIAQTSATCSVESLHKPTTRPPSRLQVPRVDAEDEDDTLYPEWAPHHSCLRLAIPTATPSKIFVVIRLFGQRNRSPLHVSKSSRVVGTVTIPLSDINVNGSQSWQLLSYRVKRPSGRLQGVLNLSARFSLHACCTTPRLPPQYTISSSPSAPPLPTLAFVSPSLSSSTPPPTASYYNI